MASARRVSVHLTLKKDLDSPDLDPNAPKRGLSAYMFFANDQRDKVREDNPGIKFGKLCIVNPHPSSWLTPCLGEVGKLLGEKWKELSAKEKEPYEKKAKQDKERYEREKAEYAGGVSETRVQSLVCYHTDLSHRLLMRMMRTRTRRVSIAMSISPIPEYY